MEDNYGEQEQPTKPFKIKVCPECGKEFTCYKAKKYDTKECAAKAHAKNLERYVKLRKQLQELAKEVNCKTCNKVFEKLHGNEKYCSDQCRAMGLLKTIKASRGKK